MRPRLHHIHRLRAVRRDDPRDRAVQKRDRRALHDIPRRLVVLEHGIGAEAQGGGEGLFGRGGDVAAVEGEGPGFGGEDADRVERAGEAAGVGWGFGVAGVVDEGGLDALGGGDGEGRADHAGGQAGEDVLEWSWFVGFGIVGVVTGAAGAGFEHSLDVGEGHEAEGVFAYCADDHSRASGVEGGETFVPNNRGDDLEGIAARDEGGRSCFELHSL